MRALRLGVNIDHVATVRNARGGRHPDPVAPPVSRSRPAPTASPCICARTAATSATTTWTRMRAALPGAKLNLEMAATEEMVAIACRARPHAFCLVPEKRTEVTTEGGLDVAGQQAALAPVVARLAAAGIRVSLFIDPDPAQLEAAAAIGAAVVELHTGAYAEGRPGELDRLARAAALTVSLGLECHAGHGLTYEQRRPGGALPEVVELNIGHFLIGEAIFEGLPAAITRMKLLMAAARTA